MQPVQWYPTAWRLLQNLSISVFSVSSLFFNSLLSVVDKTSSAPPALKKAWHCLPLQWQIPSFSSLHNYSHHLVLSSSPRVGSFCSHSDEAVVISPVMAFNGKPTFTLLHHFILLIFSFLLQIYFHQDHGHYILHAFSHSTRHFAGFLSFTCP